MQRRGYRDENLFGDGVYDPMEVATYEIRELGNVDICRQLTLAYANSLTKDELDAARRVYDYPAQGLDATDEDMTLIVSALRRVLDGRDFCKWLCNSATDVAYAYIAPFGDARERLEESFCSVYEIPDDAIALTDQSDADGCLWAWKTHRDNALPVRTMPMRDALAQEGADVADMLEEAFCL